MTEASNLSSASATIAAAIGDSGPFLEEDIRFLLLSVAYEAFNA